jgi:hypothetical protein
MLGALLSLPLAAAFRRLHAPDLASNATARQVVVARYKEEVEWLAQLPSDLPVVVYQSSDPSAPHFVPNVGNEASKYLAYIVDQYDALPDAVMFMQAGQQDWHDPVPKDATLNRWDWGAASRNGGMAFLPTTAPCIVEDAEGRPAGGVKAGEGSASDCAMVVEHTPRQMPALQRVYPELFAAELGALPERWLTHCCAQFEVTREAIQRHPRAFYEDLLNWASREGSVSASDVGHGLVNKDDKRGDPGHIFEVMWALMFGSPDATRIL